MFKNLKMHSKYIPLLQNTIAEILGSLHAFSNEELNQVPYKGSWSAAQVADHVIKSLAGLPKILAGSPRFSKTLPVSSSTLRTSLLP